MTPTTKEPAAWTRDGLGNPTEASPMSSTPSLAARSGRCDLTDTAMEGMALNEHQSRLIYNPSEEVDSISEYAVQLGRTASREQLAIVKKMVNALGELMGANRSERECHAEIASALDKARQVKWTYRSAALALRDALADLGNPVIDNRTRRERRRQVLNTVASIDADSPLMLRSDEFAAELRSPKKHRTLVALLDEVAV